MNPWRLLLIAWMVVSLAFVARAAFGQTFNPPNLAEIETEFDLAWSFVLLEFHEEDGFKDREKFAALDPGWTASTLPTCASLKQPIFEVPPDATYTLRDLNLHNVGPFRCNFSAGTYVLPVGRFPANVGFLFHCSCEDAGLLWRKTMFSDEAYVTRPTDWYIFDEIP